MKDVSFQTLFEDCCSLGLEGKGMDEINEYINTTCKKESRKTERQGRAALNRLQKRYNKGDKRYIEDYKLCVSLGLTSKLIQRLKSEVTIDDDSDSSSTCSSSSSSSSGSSSSSSSSEDELVLGSSSNYRMSELVLSDKSNFLNRSFMRLNIRNINDKGRKKTSIGNFEINSESDKLKVKKLVKDICRYGIGVSLKLTQVGIKDGTKQYNGLVIINNEVLNIHLQRNIIKTVKSHYDNELILPGSWEVYEDEEEKSGIKIDL
jgi:hypothetical protein